MAELDPDTRVMMDAFAAGPARPKLYAVPPAEGRELYRRQSAGFAAPPVPLASVDDRTVPGPAGPIPVRVYRPAGPDGPGPGIVFLHGGGWVLGDLDTHDGACRHLAAGTGAVVVAVHYRLAPEHRFPAALEDAHAALVHVAANGEAFGIDPARLSVAGDSAGGNLAAVLAQLARDEALPLAAQLLIYPATTGHTDTPSYREMGTGYPLETAAMAAFYAHYARDAADADNPLLAPLRSPNLAGVAPAIVVTAGFDPLHDDGVLYAAALEKSGVPVRLLAFPSLAHGFLLMDGISAGAREAIAAIVAALRGETMPGAPEHAPATGETRI